MEQWNNGTLEPWNPGTMEQWNPGTMEPWSHEKIGKINIRKVTHVSSLLSTAKSRQL
jgi:hypothetical protein